MLYVSKHVFSGFKRITETPLKTLQRAGRETNKSTTEKEKGE